MIGIGNNLVELLGSYGSDETHAMSAWTSTEREPGKLARIEPLLRRLASEGHHSPFEKSYLHFLVRTDVASHIHLLKHRIGVSINAESARYKEFSATKSSYFIPSDWPDWAQSELREIYERAEHFYHQICQQLRPVLGPKRAKESARFVLPYGHQITSDVGFNFRSFVHFQKLRNHETAQREIREIAREMLRLVWGLGTFDISLRSFGFEKEELTRTDSEAGGPADEGI